jgi:hypothetical protein
MRRTIHTGGAVRRAIATVALPDEGERLVWALPSFEWSPHRDEDTA